MTQEPADGKLQKPNFLTPPRLALNCTQIFTMPTYYLACDLGADSGRLMLGTLADGKISLEELHRFPNSVENKSGALHWNIEKLFGELKTGLKKAAAKNLPIASISTDSW